MPANQTDAQGLSRGLSSNFELLRRANHENFSKECVICMVKNALIKIMFTNKLTMRL